MVQAFPVRRPHHVVLAGCEARRPTHEDNGNAEPNRTGEGRTLRLTNTGYLKAFVELARRTG
jgi:hypothetical protein